ncbi:MAG: methyltransferase [Methylotetracoccus sp.]
MIELRPPLIALALALAARGFDAFVPDWGLFHLSSTKAAPAISGFGFAIMITGWLTFRRLNIAVSPVSAASELVTGSIYRFSRNPMYLGLLLILAGIAVAVGTPPYYLATAAFFIVIDQVFCPYEEGKLSAAFGRQYAAYRNRVRRWL